MDTYTIEINDPKAKRFIDDLVKLGLISVKEAKPSWDERWATLSKSLPNVMELSEEDILNEISNVRKDRENL